MIGIAYIKYPDGHSARIAVAELMTSQDGVIGITDANGNEYLTHISNVVIEIESKTSNTNNTENLGTKSL